MVRCSKCGTDNPIDALYCMKCGANTKSDAKPTIVSGERVEKVGNGSKSIKSRPAYQYEAPAARIKLRIAGLLGALSAGAVLIIIGIIFVLYPIDFQTISEYFSRMIEENTYIKPPMIVLDPGAFFFNALGVWSLVLAALHFFMLRNPRKAASDILRGVFLFFIAFLISRYAVDALTWQIAVAYFLLVLGALIVVRWVINVAAQVHTKEEAT